jgi:hypothetical protein
VEKKEIKLRDGWETLCILFGKHLLIESLDHMKIFGILGRIR